METNKAIFKNRSLTMFLFVFASVLCGYLVFRTMQINGNTIDIADLCKVIFGNSCDKILSNRIGWMFGIPLSGIGLAYFGLLGLLFSFRKPVIDRLVIILGALGTGVGILLSFFIIKGGLTCPLCLGIHFINLLILISLLFGLFSSYSGTKEKRFISRSFYLRWSILLFLIIGIGCFSEYLLLKKSFEKETKVNLDEIVKKYQTEKVYTIPANDSSPHLGSTDAPVQIVVFSSFQCPACKTFRPVLENIYKKFGNKIGITFKNFPLSSICNPALQGNMQPQSCDAAFAAIAAQQQNRFWEYHDQLFQSNLGDGDKVLRSIAKKMELNLDKWETDRHSDTIKQLLNDDLKIAYTIGINATPSVFINGRGISNFQESVINFLIENELNRE